jgi:ATP-dependent Clp protease protease subunit
MSGMDEKETRTRKGFSTYSLERNKWKHSKLMKELEWGINTDTNTVYMAYDFDMDNLYTIVTKTDSLLRHNPEKEVNMIISSYGGDVYSMLGMIDYIRNLPVKVNTHCLGASMSAAAVMLACGTGKRTMSKNSSVMIHEGSAFEVGKTSDVLKGADHLKLLQKSVCDILGEVTKKSSDFWEGITKQDTYLTADDCLEYGVIDEVV